MKLRSDLTIDGKLYRAGDEVAWTQVYPFFLFHMLLFGGSGFFMAYSSDRPSLGLLYAHGGFAILIYLIFYVNIFGREQVKWMLINSALGIFGIYSQIDWMLALFGKTAASFPVYVHVIPFLYYVMYTFLLHQAVLDATGARENEARRKVVEHGYIAVSAIVYAIFYFT